MQFTNGFRLDDLPIKQRANSWYHTKNMLFKQGFTSPSNEQGLDLHIETVNGISQTFLDKQCIGVIPTHDKFVVFSSNGFNSEIGIVIDGAYTTKLLGTDTSNSLNDLLGFKLNCPIEGIFKVNYLGEIIVAWCDGIKDEANTPKVLNLDRFPFDTTNGVLNNPLQVNLINLFPEANVPLFSYDSDDEYGGSIQTGTYWFTVSYEIDDIDITNPIGISRPVYINSNGTQIYNKTNAIGGGQPISYCKSEPGEYTTKAIRFIISNIDTRFKYFRIIVIQQINGVQFFSECAKLSTGNGTVNFTYTGQKTNNAFSSDTVLLAKDSYSRFKTMTQLNDEIIALNVRKSSTINYQSYANNIKVTWTQEDVIPTSTFVYSNDIKTTFNLKGVLPEEVYALYLAFYLKDGTLSPAFHIPGRVAVDYGGGILENDLLSSINPILTSAEELAISPNVRLFHTRDLSTNAANGSLMGYWENETELYPDTNDFDIKDASGVIGTLRNQKVRHHKAPGYKNLYTGTPPDDRVIKCIGIQLDNIYIPDEILDKVQAITLLYAKRGNNLANTTILGISPIHESSAGIGANYSRGFDFGLLTDKPAINPRYLKRYHEVDTSTFITNVFPDSTNFQVIEDTEYHPENITAFIVPPNDNDPECISFHHTNAALFGVSDTSATKNICGICNYVPNMFESFYEQELASIGIQWYTNTNNYYSALQTTGFDAFISLLLTIWTDESVSSPPDRYHVYTLLYSRYNIAYRSKSTYSFNDSTVQVYGLEYKYNKDFNALTDIKVAFTYNPFNPSTDYMPYRIPRSAPNQSETVKIGWRNFPTGRYFEMPKNKGTGWKLAVLNQSLVINMEFSAFLAQTKDRLGSNIQEIFLGIGDIFDRRPDDIMPIPEGYVGCQSQWSGLLCKLGYVFADRKAGKIFVINKTVKEISKEGQRNFFRNFLNTREDIDNPFTEIGIVCAYDEFNDRLLITKKDYAGEYGKLLINIGEYEYAFYTAILTVNDIPTVLIDKLYYTQLEFFIDFFNALVAALPTYSIIKFTNTIIRIFPNNGIFDDIISISINQLIFQIKDTVDAEIDSDPFTIGCVQDTDSTDLRLVIYDKTTSKFYRYLTMTYFPANIYDSFVLGGGFQPVKQFEFINQADPVYIRNTYISDTNIVTISIATGGPAFNTAITVLNTYTFYTSVGDQTTALFLFYDSATGELILKNNGDTIIDTLAISDVPIHCCKSSIGLQRYYILTSSIIYVIDFALLTINIINTIFSDGFQYAFKSCCVTRNQKLVVTCINEYPHFSGSYNNSASFYDEFTLVLLFTYNFGQINTDNTDTNIGSTLYYEPTITNGDFIVFTDKLSKGMFVLRDSDYKLIYDKYPIDNIITTDIQVEQFYHGTSSFPIPIVTGIPESYTKKYLTTTNTLTGAKRVQAVDFFRVINVSTVEKIIPTKSFTISYYPNLNNGEGGWFGLHDYIPNYMFNNRNGLFLLDNSTKKIYKHNSSTKVGTYFDGVVYPSYIELVFNLEETESKEFFSLSWLSTVQDLEATKVLHDKTITHLIVYDENRCSGLITLHTSDKWFTHDPRNTLGNWNYNNFRDMLVDNNLPFFDDERELIDTNIATAKAWFKQNKFLGKFVIVRFIYDNSSQNNFTLHDATANVKKLNR
jgi:hypothetical protein